MILTCSNHPGARVAGPSAHAADAIALRLRDRLLTVITAAIRGGLTADGAAAALSLPTHTVRPRVAELHRLGRIADARERRSNGSAMTATVRRACSPPLYDREAAR